MTTPIIDQLNNLILNCILFTVVITLILTILLLLYNNPFRKQLVIELDQLKSSIAVKSVVTTLIVLMMYIVYGLFAAVDCVNHAYLLLQVSLMGFSLFLLLTIHNLHVYIKEVVMVTDRIVTAQKQNQAYEESKKISDMEANLIRTKISGLKTEITKLVSKHNIKEQELQSKRADCTALKNQLEGLHAEYDCLLAYNEDVRDQLRNINENMSHSIENKMVSSDDEKARSEKTGSWPWSRWGL